MDSEKLSKREKQPGHDRTFADSENKFFSALKELTKNTSLICSFKPLDLKNIFTDGEYTCGIIPEASIRNPNNNHILFFEVKKQGPRGNADERATKHHTERFIEVLKEKYNFKYHPFFTIFCESLATERRYTVKHSYFYKPQHYFCWKDYSILHLQTYINTLIVNHLEYNI